MKATTAIIVKDQVIAKKIENATMSLTYSYSKRLGELSLKQLSVICDYISALRSEIKLSDKYRQSILRDINKYILKIVTVTYIVCSI